MQAISSSSMKDVLLTLLPTGMQDTITDKCTSLCNKFALKIDDFKNILEAFLLQNDNKLTHENMGKLEGYVYKEESLKTKMTKENTYNTPNIATYDSNKRHITHVTPDDSKRAKIITKLKVSPGSVDSPDMPPDSQSKLPPGEAFKERQGRGNTVDNFNSSIGPRADFEASTRAPLGMRCQILTNDNDFENMAQRYRYMFTTLDERAKGRDRHVQKLMEDMCAMANIPVEDLQSIGKPSNDLVWVCGTVCCESSEGKMNKVSVLLEGSRRDGGRRVKLNLKEVESYSLFPGQIILAEGISTHGREMIVKRIIEGVPCPLPTSTPSKLLEYHHQKSYQNSMPISITVASGPFTTSDILDYQPLMDLFKTHIVAKQPDVLVLIGPFVDINQKLLSSGLIELPESEGFDRAVSYELVFVKMISEMIELVLDDYPELPTNIIIIPSLSDAHHEFVYPQPPLGNRDKVTTSIFVNENNEPVPLGVLDLPDTEGNRKRVHCLSNPCMFRVNEVLVGVTSNDNLFNMTTEEISENRNDKRLARLSSHIVKQQSFSPQFPPPPSSMTQMDWRHSRHWQMKVSPDILIMPSKLAHLVADVSGTLYVNPGFLTKGVNGGSFAELHVHPISEKELRDAHIEGKTEVLHKVPQRTFVNILKI